MRPESFFFFFLYFIRNVKAQASYKVEEKIFLFIFISEYWWMKVSYRRVEPSVKYHSKIANILILY